MLLLQQLLGLQLDQQTGAGSNQDAPSAPPSTDHQEQSQSPPPPPTQQQAPPPPPPSTPGHQQQQAPPPPQQNQFCSNCSGSRGRQDDYRQYLENMIPVIVNKCRHFSTVFTRSIFSVGAILIMMICTGFGLHLPTILAVNVLHCFLINMNPFFLTLFSIWAFHKTVVQKRPLFNMNKWRRDFSSHCHRH